MTVFQANFDQKNRFLPTRRSLLKLVVNRSPLLSRDTSEWSFEKVNKKIRNLDRLYHIEDQVWFENRVQKYPSLKEFLFEAKGKIEEFFPDNLYVSLEKDNEFDNEQNGLFVIIKCVGNVDQVMEQLDRFDANWWLDKSEQFGDLVNFDVEFERRV